MKGMTLYVFKKGKYFALSNPTKYVKTKLYESVITRWKKIVGAFILKKGYIPNRKNTTLYFFNC